MNREKTLGERIASLRKLKGYSQEELAKLIDISRPSLVQIEKGKRNVNVNELKILTKVLQISADKLIADEFEIEEIEIEESKKEEVKKGEIRVSIPSLEAKKMKNVLLYILSKCAGMPNIGETVLNKLLYFADFNYYEIYEEHLTGATYKKKQYGPVPISLDTIIKQMNDGGLIQRVSATFHGFPQKKLIPLEQPNLKELKASETEVLDNVIEKFSHWTARDISDYSHNDVPWEASEMGEEIDYELVFYRDPQYSVRAYYSDN